MKLKIVYGYRLPFGDYKKIEDIRGEVLGRTYNSFKAVIDDLKSWETVQVQSKLGYKQVGLNERGAWVQRRWSPEY